MGVEGVESMGVSRAVSMSFVAIGLLSWYVMAEFFGFAFGFKPSWNIGLIGTGFALSDLLGIATGIGTGIALWRHTETNTLAHEIANELKKVVWPSWEETRGATVVVIIVTIVCALILGGCGAVRKVLTGWIYKA